MTTDFNNVLPPSETATAIDFWRAHVLDGASADPISASLEEEVPPLLSWIVRGGCAVQCKHCLFPFEGPKAFMGQTSGDSILSILAQLSGQGCLVHEGRQLLPWQVPVLAAATRTGHRVSLINNGQYATPSMLALCEKESFAIDALDVSVDGTESIHNAQRNSQVAWGIAMKGIQNAQRILKPKGSLSSLFTLTSLNYRQVRETGEQLAQLVDEWHVTTMSLRPGIEHMRADERQLAHALEQLMEGSFAKKVVLRSYSLSDFIAVLTILGKETARKALSNMEVFYNGLVIDIGIPFYFYPKSLQVNETLAIDADGVWRLPFCIHYTLDELRAGVDARGNDISYFSFVPVEPGMDIPSLFRVAAKQWWRAIGEKCLREECRALEQFLS